MEKTQKEYYLNEQMKAIQKELGENEDIDEISELEKIENIELSTEANEKCKSEIKKLKSISLCQQKQLAETILIYFISTLGSLR